MGNCHFQALIHIIKLWLTGFVASTNCICLHFNFSTLFDNFVLGNKNRCITTFSLRNFCFALRNNDKINHIIWMDRNRPKI